MGIIGMHALIYSKKADETRAFFQDVLGFPFVDVGHGWLIFAAPPSELAVHPTEDRGQHELFLMCDDLDTTMTELRAKGVQMSSIEAQPWGRLTHITLPSGEALGLYEPRHPTAINKWREQGAHR